MVMVQAAEVSLTELTDAEVPVPLDMMATLSSDTKKYPVTKKTGLKPALHEIYAFVGVKEDVNGEKILALDLKHKWDLEFNPTSNSNKTPEYAAISWMLQNASVILTDEKTGEQTISPEFLNEVSVQGAVKDKSNKDLSFLDLEQVTSDYSMAPNYTKEGGAYVGAALIPDDKLVTAW